MSCPDPVYAQPLDLVSFVGSPPLCCVSMVDLPPGVVGKVYHSVSG